ncbi:MAG: methylated-DNA--[protein]-cysteine S-methyltransferase [Rikenellaceae bacterium]|nr:methylated-DNA--[protein]-cysteine S-methyltransferase [Rikenellaceae bacterium]
MANVFFYETAHGPFGICERGGAVSAVFSGRSVPDGYTVAETPLIKRAAVQLGEYFVGRRREFDLPLHASGTPFELKVWQALRDIPYGQTRTYGQIAAAVGSPKACRAVGRANSRNPHIILTPCHRVIGADGRLTGFAAGLDLKGSLLALERLHSGKP